MPLADAIATKDGIAGAAADPLLLGRLGLKLGDTVKLGSSSIRPKWSLRREMLSPCYSTDCNDLVRVG
jgi:putative ABC transport system permease protein